MRTQLALAAALAATLATTLVWFPGAAAQEDVGSAVVRRLLDDDAAVRSAARAELLEGGKDVIPALIQALEELRAGRDVAGPVTKTLRVPERVPSRERKANGDIPGLTVQMHDLRDLVGLGYTPEVVTDLLENNITEGLGSVTAAAKGLLVVRATQAGHDSVRDLLQGLRMELDDFYTVDARFLVLPHGASFPADLVGSRPGDVVLADADAVRAVTQATEIETAEVVSAPRLTTAAGQRANVTLGRQISYIADFEVEVAPDGSRVTDPIVEQLFIGSVVDMKVLPGKTEGQILFDFSIAQSELREPIPVWPRTFPGTTVPVELQVPETTESKVRRALTLRDGGSALLVLPSTAEEQRLVLVTVTKLVLDEFEPEESK